MHGLRYALAYLAGDFNYFNHVKTAAQNRGNKHLLEHMDNYFKNTYDARASKQQWFFHQVEQSQRYKFLNRGHFTIVGMNPKNAQPKVTLMMRENLTTDAQNPPRDYGDISDHKQKSPFYAVRLQTLADYQNEQNARQGMFQERVKDWPLDHMTVAPLRFTPENTQDYPSNWDKKGRWAYKENLAGKGSLQIEYDKENPQKFLSLNTQFTFDDGEEMIASGLFMKKKKKQVYVYSALELFFGPGQINEWSNLGFYFIHSNVKRAQQR